MNKTNTPRNITEMTAEAHKFDGFAVRKEKGGLRFRLYVGSGVKVRPETTKAKRREAALQEAKDKLATLLSILNNKRRWVHKRLSKGARNEITALGFTIEGSGK